MDADATEVDAPEVNATVVAPHSTPLLYDLVRRRLDYADCRGLGVRPGRGVDHTCHAGASNATVIHRRWSPPTITPARRSPWHTPRSHWSSRSPSRARSMLPRQQFLQRRQDRRGTTARASAATAKATLLAARVPTRTRALPQPTHTSPSSCMENAKRRRRRRPHSSIRGILRSNPRG